MHEPSWIRWFMVAFFIFFGAWQFRARHDFAKGGGAFCSLALDEPSQARLASAYRRLEQPESVRSEAFGSALAALCLALALLAAFTRTQVVVLYAVLTVALASLLTLAYVRLQKSRRRRVASLRTRPAPPLVPWYAGLLIATTVVLPLTWSNTLPVAALLVTTAGIAIVLLACRVASLPASLSGEDVGVETFVVTQLRAVRAGSLLTISPAPSLVFEAFSGYTDSLVHAVAMSVALFAFGVLYARKVLCPRRPSQAEMTASFHA